MIVEKDESDESVATRVQAGDVEAFGVLVERYEEKLKRYGRRFLARSEDVEDIVQDVFIRSFQNIRSFDVAQRFSPWIYRSAHNAFINKIRANRFHVFDVDFDALVAHHVYEDPKESAREHEEILTLLETGLSVLAPKYREVLILHYYDGMPYKDIAEVLHVPLGTVSIRLKRAKEALKSHLAKKL